MPTVEEILATLRERRAILSGRYPIRRLALFGSWARGEAREDSGIHVLVDVDPSIGLRFVDLGEDLERALGRRVDLVSQRAFSGGRPRGCAIASCTITSAWIIWEAIQNDLPTSGGS